MNKLQTPFETALGIAWSDGRFSLASARLLEKLQSILHISDEERGEIEEQFNQRTLPTIEDITERGNGLGDIELEQWINQFEKAINKIKQKVNSHFFVLVGKDESVLSEKIINEIGKENVTSVHDLPINQISSIASCCDFYIGNDTFPHHICCQRSIPSIVLLIDTPRAYSDYSKHQHQITPENVSLDDIKHGTRAGPDSIKVEKVFNKFLELLG